jgi:hypothetical protein
MRRAVSTGSKSPPVLVFVVRETFPNPGAADATLANVSDPVAIGDKSSGRWRN